MEEEERLELRMYFFVPYNISEIQKGIQAGHCALDYAFVFGDSDLFKNFMIFDKTWIILNGGTTREQLDNPGTIQQIYYSLVEFNIDNPKDKIQFINFKEPDLNVTTTAICFICDERVWDYENYPEPEIYQDGDPSEPFESYDEWVEFIGGKKNLFLRELIKDKKLA